ncbi:hypothetical protein [Streptomyces sp. NPDC018693]|uniref:hypothetical protein n=1 Tax=unclassified Streptomyces TaxID=2593676 RepID=UPI0037A9E156
MRERTAGCIEWLLLLLVWALLPARGRHRALPTPERLPDAVRPLDSRPDFPQAVDPIHYDTPLVRPYLRTLDLHRAEVSA